MPTISFALQAGLTEVVEWSTLARNAEKAGFEAFLVADHPGVTASPFVALATAAAATSRIVLGTYVANLGVRDPLQLASDVATLDVVSRGRARFGVGAGPTPPEGEINRGREPPPPQPRAASPPPPPATRSWQRASDCWMAARSPEYRIAPTSATLRVEQPPRRFAHLPGAPALPPRASSDDPCRLTPPRRLPGRECLQPPGLGL